MDCGDESKEELDRNTETDNDANDKNVSYSPLTAGAWPRNFVISIFIIR